jgi:hypothetical protein
MHFVALFCGSIACCFICSANCYINVAQFRSGCKSKNMITDQELEVSGVVGV